MTAPTETLTIHLTAEAARRLRRVAEISRRPLDEIIADTLQGSLPPMLEDVPAPFQTELSRLESLSTTALRQQLRAALPAPQLAHYDQLLAANSANTLTPAGQDEMAELRRAADQLMYRKAYAALILRGRGERIPSLTELEAEFGVMADIPEAILQRLRRQAGPRCGYCRTSTVIIGRPLTVEHLRPVALGGSSNEDNLWLSCRRCNEFKGVQIEAVDPETGLVVPLFNPRRQVWREHFSWSNTGLHILGSTPTGRATVEAPKLNNSEIVAARTLWVGVGWHPPAE